MGKTLAYKILENHLISGELKAGNEITIKIDQTLTQDSTGTMVYLQLEAMDIEKVKTELSVAYIDHNTLQTGFENADDHAFIKSVAQRHGILFSKPGNGICHQLHLENYGNTSAASIPITLTELVEQGKLHEGMTILITGFGAGLTWGGAIIRF